MSVEKIDTLIVGAGQAGIALSEHLGNHGVPFLFSKKAASRKPGALRVGMLW